MMKKICFILILLMVVCGLGVNVFAQKEVVMKKAVMIIAEENFRDEELFEPKAILEQAGIQVKVASSTLKVAKGIMGATIRPDILVKDINLSDFDAVIFIGGPGASQYWNDPLAQALARNTLEKNKIIAAICIAPVILAKAGILKGRRATVWSTESGQLQVSGGAIYTGKNVERDANIITAAGPFAASEFGHELVKALLN